MIGKKGGREDRSLRYCIYLSLFLIVMPNSIRSNICTFLSGSLSTLPFCFLLPLYPIHMYNTYTHTHTHMNLVSLFCLFPTAETITTWPEDTSDYKLLYEQPQNQVDPCVYWKTLVSMSLSLGSAFKISHFVFWNRLHQKLYRGKRTISKKKKKTSYSQLSFGGP